MTSRYDRTRGRRPWRWNHAIIPAWDVVDGKAAFRSASDQLYRVYDRRVVDGTPITLELGDPDAWYRVFVPKYGPKKRFWFGAEESHAIDPRTLSDQLRRAKSLRA